MFRCLGREKIPDALNIVELGVAIHCPGCERKIRKAISKVEGVDSVDIDSNRQKVTVTGYVDQRRILKTVRRAGTKAEFWPEPYDSEYHAFVTQYFDEPTYSSTYNYYRHGHNSSVQGTFPDPIYSHVIDDHAIAMFNDENVHACAIM